MTTAKEPTVRIVTMTPEWAAQLLGVNVPSNRNVNPRNHANITHSMGGGEWDLNGESIKVDRNGRLIDGQHRLGGCVESGKPFRTVLVEGLDPSAITSIDRGKMRSYADELKFRGESDVNNLAALIRRMTIYEKYGLRDALHKTAGGRALTNKEMARWFNENQWVRDSLNTGRRMRPHVPMSAALINFLNVLFERLDAGDAEFFWSKLESPSDLSGTDPIFQLKQRFQRIMRDRGLERNQFYIGALTIKAWNYYRAGQDVNRLDFTLGGANPDRLQEPR